MLAQDLFQHPDAAVHGARAVGEGRHRQDARHREDAAAVAVGERHLAHRGPGRAQPVDRRERLVEERIVAGDEVLQAAVLAQDAVEEQARLVDHRGAQGRGHLRELGGVEGLAGELVEAEPLRAEAVEEGAGARVGEQAAGLGGEHRRIAQGPGVGQGRQLRVGRGRPQQVGQPRGQLVVAERDDVGSRARAGVRRDEEELRGHQDGLEHQAQRLGIGPPAGRGEGEDFHQDVDLGVGRRPAIGAAGERPGGLARGLRLVLRVGRRGAEVFLQDGGRRPGQHLVGDVEVFLDQERRDGVRIAGAENLLGQLGGDVRVDAEEIVQGVAVLGAAQAADDELAGILGAEILQARDPVDEELPFLVGRLLFLGLGRHVVRLDVADRLLPQGPERRGGGALHRVLERHAAFLLLLAVAADAIGVEERGDLVLEGFQGRGARRREFGVRIGVRPGRRRPRQDDERE